MSAADDALLLNSPSDFLRLWARRRPGGPWVHDIGAGRVVTFAEGDERVDRLARMLLGGAVVPGDRVAILADDGHDVLEVVLACIRSGVVAVPLATGLTDLELNALLLRANPRHLFVGPPHRVAASEVAAGVASIRGVSTFATASYEELLAAQPMHSDRPRPHPETTACLSFTSGTTGAAKGVEQSVRMLVAMVWAGLVDGEVGPGEVRYCGVPLHRTVGLVHALVGLTLGLPTVLAPEFDAATVFELAGRGSLDVVTLPTPMLAALVAEVEASGRVLHLRRVVYGAEPAPADLLTRAAAALGCEMVRTFGATTESGTQCCLSSADHLRALAGETPLLDTVGSPSFGVDLRVVDDALRDVPAGTVGEIAVRSAQLLTAYLGQPDLTAEALRDGWFRAGDLGFVDAEGRVHLAGRADEVIVRDGVRLYPLDIERAVAAHPAVAEVAVLGVADARLGEAVHAWVVVAADVDEGALRSWCRDRLRPEQVPEAFHATTTLPRNAAGKVLKRVLRAAGAVPDPAD